MDRAAPSTLEKGKKDQFPQRPGGGERKDQHFSAVAVLVPKRFHK
jgi:hypothetical protein